MAFCRETEFECCGIVVARTFKRIITTNATVEWSNGFWLPLIHEKKIRHNYSNLIFLTQFYTPDNQ